jgi:diadenylate cyclase
VTVFHPKTALHDGGMILANEKVTSAACVFPVSQKELADRSMGLRHRAAIGLTEETDAVTIVVSEETGAISICMDGTIERSLHEDEFRKRLEEIFLSDEQSDEKVGDEQLDGEGRVAATGDRSLVSD